MSCRCSNQRVNVFYLVLFTFVFCIFALYVYFAIQLLGCNIINKGVLIDAPNEKACVCLFVNTVSTALCSYVINTSRKGYVGGIYI